MSAKRVVFNIANRIFLIGIKLLGQRKGTFVSARLAEQLMPVAKVKTTLGTVQFYCPGKIPLWRARTLLTKEPETIEWINTFDENDVFWDIGANVGVYSLYAALCLTKVMAFEPAASNYYVLNRNIEINHMDNRISALCIAFSNVSRLDSFYMSNTKCGGALHSFSESVDFQGRPFTASFNQAMLGFSIDDFIEQFNPPFPTHIKIDVDGIENKIIAGAQRTISNSRLKSLLIELDTQREDYREAIILLEKANMKLQTRIRASTKVEAGKFSSIYNHIFARTKGTPNKWE